MRKSTVAWLASQPEETRRAFLYGLSPNALAAMPWLWELWANPQHQCAPEGDWRVWAILGGRGAGKTRAGAEWVRAQVEGAGPLDPGRCRRVALVGETLDQVRAVMVEGESGLLACAPPDRRPAFQASRNRLVWPNGAEAALASASSPEALRGPQFDAAWSDELAKWRRCREAWDMLQFCLRLPDAGGRPPRQIVTTTPRDNPVLREILASPDTAATHGATAANAAWLAPGFAERLEARYGGTALGRQEISGELLEAHEGALWSRPMLDGLRVAAAPPLDRVVVAVDPPVTAHGRSDECGIVVAGIRQEGEDDVPTVYVLDDRSVQGKSPHDWARRAVDALEESEADRIVAEVNQGGDLVESLLRQIDPDIPFRAVRATRSKRLRAEPVAALYEQGRVHHVGAFAALEDQMCRFTAAGGDGIKSPDRLDALVWAVTDLALGQRARLRVRTL
ncbi:terminase family protein [Paralimibaculum aggregatum]|uniref:Terminase family protein n=1 Tax=Paralimibaculum aggregatum TaxID=3036245 RepID=A0ABQ6LCY5_9RHOB|nr:terminase family protein [Limibaculum sp. NKW23]GMG81226.1 terminase family protein [Limibaculum sp. NKW23]